MPRIDDMLEAQASNDGGVLRHFDSDNGNVKLAQDTDTFLNDPSARQKMVCANAYLGCRAIRRGLEEGADIVICGRVADASPVMAAAQWWHGWEEDNYDALAGSLLAGHLIECSTYGSGANFAGFTAYETDDLLRLACPIAEIDEQGDCVITKHDKLHAIITEDVVKCQMLYELQGNIYLNSDVKADLSAVKVKQIGEHRVHVSGTKGQAIPSSSLSRIRPPSRACSDSRLTRRGCATDILHLPRPN